MNPARKIPIPQPDRLLNDSEMAGAFAALSSDDPVWLALNQVIRNYIVEVALEVAAPGTAKEHGPLAHAAGGLEWLGRLQADLAERFALTHKAPDILL